MSNNVYGSVYECQSRRNVYDEAYQYDDPIRPRHPVGKAVTGTGPAGKTVTAVGPAGKVATIPREVV